MLERIFRIRPAYDCIRVQPCVHGSATCIPGTGGSHGRHNAELHLTVRGADAEITLAIGTGWDLPTVPAPYRGGVDHPQGMAVSFHTGRPRRAGQDRCDTIPGALCKDWAGCYADTGYSMADEPTRLLVEKGSDAVWEWLEALHAKTLAEMAEADA